MSLLEYGAFSACMNTQRLEKENDSLSLQDNVQGGAFSAFMNTQRLEEEKKDSLSLLLDNVQGGAT